MIIVINDSSNAAKELLTKINKLKEDKSVTVYEENDILLAFCRDEAKLG